MNSLFEKIKAKAMGLPLTKAAAKWVCDHYQWDPLPESAIGSAREKVEAVHKKYIGSTAVWDRALPASYKYDLSIIVPVYNAMKYLRECVDSILDQKTEYSYDVILVDDGSIDGSGAFLDNVAADRVTVIHQENKGQAEARNTGICHAMGRYLMFVDSDDSITDCAVDALLKNAFEHDADIVQGSYVMKMGDKSLERILSYDVVEKGQGVYGYPWGKVYKNELLKKVRFPAGNAYEDSIIKGLICPLAKTTVLLPQIVYKYRVNPYGVSATSIKSVRCIDTYYILECIYDARQQLGIPSDDTWRSAVIWQASSFVIHRCGAIGDENLRYVFSLCCQFAEKNGVTPQYGEKYGYWAQQVCIAFERKEFKRWKIASMMI